METKNQKKIVTAPSLENTEKLYGLYRQQYGAGRTPDDFYRFMTAPGVDRQTFLYRNSGTKTVLINNTIIHKCV